MYNYLIDNYLSTFPKNRFFSADDALARKERILSGGCAEKDLTFGFSPYIRLI